MACETLPGLGEVMTALGAKTADLKDLPAPDREVLKRWLCEERAAIAAEAK